MRPRPMEGLKDLAAKAAHAGLREFGQAPDQRDARRLVRTYPKPFPNPDGPRILFLTPRSWASHVQWDAMLAQALRLRGADVRFLTCGGGLTMCDRSNVWKSPPPTCRTCSSYVRDSLDAHGFPQTEMSRHWADGTAWPELDHLSLDELAAVDYRGLPLGELVDIPVKWFLMRSNLQNDPLAGQTYREFLRSGRVIVDALLIDLDQIKPDSVVLCNGLFLFERIALEICERQGIDYYTYERGFIKETLLYRKNAISCYMDMSPFWPQWRDRALTTAEDTHLDEYLQQRRKSERSIDQYWDKVEFEANIVDESLTRIVAFPNLTWDSAVIGRSAAFEDLESWLVSIITFAATNPSVHLTVRIHPAETKLAGKETREPVESALVSHFDELPQNVEVIEPSDPRSSYSIIEASDIVLVFSSTTGLEAALMGKPVLVGGDTHYQSKGFTIDPLGPREYLDHLSRIIKSPRGYTPDIQLARRYAYLLFFRAAISRLDMEEHVLGLARIKAASLVFLEPGQLPELDRLCNAILCSEDLAPQ